MTQYYRPIVMTDVQRPAAALTLAGGWCWFDRVVVMARGQEDVVCDASDVPPDVLKRLTSTRKPLLGISFSAPQIMGILNVTPDSFSDGGDFLNPADALSQSQSMIADGAAILDIGGESTRPGAKEVPADEEARRVGGAVQAIRAQSAIPLSIDTRKAAVAEKANALLQGTAWMINDVSAARFDHKMPQVAARTNVPICLMHSVGTPETMQAEAEYRHVCLDIYDHLEERIAAVVQAGVARENIIVDPGIGFGKTLEHNLALIENISLFHGLGCPILLGVSRKRFIGAITGADDPKDRAAGSVAVAQIGVQQGVQILRVHDTKPTKQMIDLQMAVVTGSYDT